MSNPLRDALRGKLMFLTILALVMGLVNITAAELVAHWKLDGSAGMMYFDDIRLYPLEPATP